MATVYYPTDKVKKIERVFLAGSIEQNKAKMWQDEVIEALKNTDLTIYNPRRMSWDESWVQSIDNKEFNHQVSWELECLEKSDLIIMYFDPATKSPISLLELGLYYKKMMVCCPEGFWRKGNVDIVAKRFEIQVAEDLDDLIKQVKNQLKHGNIV